MYSCMPVGGDSLLSPALVWGEVGEPFNDHLPWGPRPHWFLWGQGTGFSGILICKHIASEARMAFNPLHFLVLLLNGRARNGDQVCMPDHVFCA